MSAGVLALVLRFLFLVVLLSAEASPLFLI